MSKMIEFSEADYARMRDAAAAAGVPLDEWIVTNLPLNGIGVHAEAPTAQPRPGHKPAKTMADVLAGRLGVVGSGGGERVAQDHSRIFGDILEEKRRAGRL